MELGSLAARAAALDEVEGEELLRSAARADMSEEESLLLSLPATLAVAEPDWTPPVPEPLPLPEDEVLVEVVRSELMLMS